MNIDRYTKIVLTVIASALLWLCYQVAIEELSKISSKPMRERPQIAQHGNRQSIELLQLNSLLGQPRNIVDANLGKPTLAYTPPKEEITGLDFADYRVKGFKRLHISYGGGVAWTMEGEFSNQPLCMEDAFKLIGLKPEQWEQMERIRKGRDEVDTGGTRWESKEKGYSPIFYVQLLYSNAGNYRISGFSAMSSPQHN